MSGNERRNKVRIGRSLLKIALLVGLVVACIPPVTPLIISSGSRAADETARSPGLAKKSYRRIMVLPPSGDVKGAFELQLNLFERSFLQRNVTVISPAVTGRAAIEHINPLNPQTTTGGGGGLTDAERALILAKQTGADAMLQVGTWQWIFEVGARCYQKTGNSYSESVCSPTVPFAVKLVGKKLQFLGRVIDVESGEVMASIKVEQLDINNLNMQLNAFNANPSPSIKTVRISPGLPNMYASASSSFTATHHSASLQLMAADSHSGSQLAQFGGFAQPPARRKTGMGFAPGAYGGLVLACPSEQSVKACEMAQANLTAAIRPRDRQIAAIQVQQACGGMLDAQACKAAEQATIEEVIQKIADVVMGIKTQ